MRTLNGWQRLWIVLSVLLVLPVGWVSFHTAPKAKDLIDWRVSQSIELVGKHLEATTPGYKYEGRLTVRQEYYSDLSDEQIIDRLHSKFADKVDLAKIDLEYEKKQAALPVEIGKHAGLALLAWLLPVGVVYALGTAVAWVIRGFKK